jgi:hypothetical protein
MSLLDDARRMDCACDASFQNHAEFCLLDLKPKIVAALEAAERLIEAGDPVETDRGGRGVCQYCLAPNYAGDYLSFGPPKDVEHAAACPYGALLTAFRGESA